MRMAWTNFNGGLGSPVLESRYSLAKYPTLARTIKNFVPQIHGSVARRAGTKYIDTIAERGINIIIPFVFNNQSDNCFVIIFSDRKMSVYSKETGHIVTLDAPYNASDLQNNNKISINYSQIGDIIYLAHEDYPLHKILRTGTAPNFTWKIEEVALNSSLASPSSISCTFHQTPPQTGQVYPPENYDLSYKISTIDNKGVSSVGSAISVVKGRYPTEWVVGDYVDITWNAISGAEEYNIYKESAGTFGYIGTVLATNGTSFRDNNYEADIADTPQEDWFPFKDGNHPSIVAFHQQRMVLAGTKKNPQTFYMSRSGDFENFRKSRPLQDDDPIEYTLSSGTIDSIQWAATFGDLLIGTGGAEYKVSGSNGTGSPITAKEVSISTQSFFGSTKIIPIVIGNSVLHAQRYNAKVRDLYYSLEKDGYAGNDLTLLTPNLFGEHNLKQWCFQQTPNSTLWVVRADGALFSLTYVKEQEIYGWAEHTTVGKFLACCTLSGDNHDVVLVLVEREANGERIKTLEYFTEPFGEYTKTEDAFFVDSGVTYSYETPVHEVPIPPHLQGNKLIALVNGSPYKEFIITDNKLIFENIDVKKITLGLSYTSIISMMPVNLDTQQGSTLGLKRTYGKCLVKVNRSVGGKYGSSDDIDKMFDFKLSPQSYDTPHAPFSGEYAFTVPNAQRNEASLFIAQNDALPLEILSIVCTVDFGEQG